jgi:hypothetical protein
LASTIVLACGGAPVPQSLCSEPRPRRERKTQDIEAAKRAYPNARGKPQEGVTETGIHSGSSGVGRNASCETVHFSRRPFAFHAGAARSFSVGVEAPQLRRVNPSHLHPHGGAFQPPLPSFLRSARPAVIAARAYDAAISTSRIYGDVTNSPKHIPGTATR